MFILIAILGLAFLVDKLDSLFIFLKYFGAIYLVIMGVMLWKSKLKDNDGKAELGNSLLSSFLAGLLVTIGDQKAILFYLVFFPAFIDLSTITLMDTLIIIAIAILSIAIAKLSYAYLACKSSTLMNKLVQQKINRIASLVLFGVAITLVLNANG